MKSYHRVVLCCFVAWFCSALVECQGDLLDADGDALKKGNLADKVSNEECESLFPKCADTGGNCTSRVVTENRTTECVCPGKSVYEANKGCTVPDQVCKTDFPKCTATGGICNVNVEEESEESAVQCECPDTSVYGASEGCTVPDEMCQKYFPKCMYTGGKCNVEVGNENEQSIVHCECPEKKGYKEGVGCKECECGINATGCSFDGDFKTCTCLPNTVEKEGRCVDCNCGKNSTGCNFLKNGRKVCKCNEKFSQNGDVCEECDCGAGSTNCTFNWLGTRNCTCKWTFFQRGDRCEDIGELCDEACGHEENIICKLKENETLCLCEEGKLFDMITKKCKTDNCYEKCGFNFGEIDDEVECKGDVFGEVNCTCINVHQKFDPDMRKCRDAECEKICGLDKNVTCHHKGNDILCLCDEGKQFDLEIKKCRNKNQTQSGLPASIIAAIVVGVLLGIVILAAAILYYLKYSNKSQSQRKAQDHRISSVNTFNTSSGSQGNYRH